MQEFISRYWDSYLIGLGVSAGITAATMSISIVFGLFLALARRSTFSPARMVAGSYVAVFRALPPLLVLYLVYFGLPTWAAKAQLFVLSPLVESLNNRILAAIVALALTSAAFSAEIIRSGIESVHENQLEAARSIGMTYRLTFIRVIIPQAARAALPPLGSEFIYVLKGTSLAAVIGVVELLRTAQIAAGATFYNLLAYSLAGAFYIAFVVMLQILLGRWENRFPATREV
jgi:His/Glu/Gln/Arg/opine family amino acid ABC transporter permease subunit